MSYSLPANPFLGLRLAAANFADTVAWLADRAESGEGATQASLNAAKVVQVLEECGVRETLARFDVLSADGMAVVWAARRLGAPVPERVAGIDLFEALLGEADRRRLRVFLLGAAPDVLGQARARLAARHPGIDLHHHHGYFTDDERGSVIAMVVAARPQFVFIALPSPAKEELALELAAAVRGAVTMGVGGAFDVVAGKTRRAPRLVQSLGLEWLFRAAQEPRRLGPRYLRTNRRFVVAVMRARRRAD